MSKINAKEEKRLRNEEYAKRFAKKKQPTGRSKKSAATFANWCRTHGHPANCRCAYE